MINKYKKYLKKITTYLNKYFEQQKPYIFCKEGCSICCETGHYPISDLEFKYLNTGYQSLNKKNKLIVKENIKKTKENYKDKSYYRCPFLIEKKCSIYKYRPLVCRSYGLLQFFENEKKKVSYYIPCCATEGLNYSTVYDEKTLSISGEKFKTLNIETEPLSYNVSYKYLLKNELNSDIEFGEVNNLIERF